MQTLKEYMVEDYPVLSWASSHNEMRGKSLKEEKQNELCARYHELHDHPDFKPQALSERHMLALRGYSEGEKHGSMGYMGSPNVNAYLRNRAGEKDKQIWPGVAAQRGVYGKSPSDADVSKVKKAVRRLSSVFTKENTNKITATVYGGVPASIGQKLMAAGPNSHHHIAGFTSTSTDESTGEKYSREHAYNDEAKDLHMIVYHLQPHTAVSVVHHSSFSENEMLLHHGAHIEYHHTEEEPADNRYWKIGKYDKFYTHHVTVHPDSKSLSKYGKYS